MAAAQAINYSPLITLIEQKASQSLSLQDLTEISEAIEAFAKTHLKEIEQDFDNPDSIKRLIYQIRYDVSNAPSFKPIKEKLHIATALACQAAQRIAEQCINFAAQECLGHQLNATCEQESKKVPTVFKVLDNSLPFYVNSIMEGRNDQVKRIGMLLDLADPLEKGGLFTPREPIDTERVLTLLTYQMNNE